MSSLTLSTLEHAQFLELPKKENTYLNVTGNINSIKIWLTSKLYVKASCILFKISIFQGVCSWYAFTSDYKVWMVRRTIRDYISELFLYEEQKAIKSEKNSLKIQENPDSGAWKVIRS